MSIERLGEIWGEWTTVQNEEGGDYLLGRGSYGDVYKCMRKENGHTFYTAIKVISIPKSEDELNDLRYWNKSESQIKSFFEDLKNDCYNEITISDSLKGHPNIVYIEDHQAISKPDGIGWDIFIRMELLESFNKYIVRTTHEKFTEDKVRKLGVDILNALVFCVQQPKAIIHRDINPKNIFISNHGTFKLGDFGIARKLENTQSILTRRAGTGLYMAPEVANGNPIYNESVDIYSLGLVLYECLNDNLLPFYKPEENYFDPDDPKHPLNLRKNGMKLPLPSKASPSMAQVILKACAYNPKDRWKPSDFLQALMDVEINQGNHNDDLNSPAVINTNTGAKIKKSRHLKDIEIIQSIPEEKHKWLEIINKRKSIIYASIFICLIIFIFNMSSIISSYPKPEPTTTPVHTEEIPASPSALPTLTPILSLTMTPTPETIVVDESNSIYVSVFIPMGASSRQVSQILYEAGLISDPGYYNKYIIDKGKAEAILSGEFNIRIDSTLTEILSIITS